MKFFCNKKFYILLPALGRMGNQFQNSAVFEAFSEHYQKRGLNLSLLCHLDKLGRRGLKTLVTMLLARLIVTQIRSSIE